MVDRNFVLRWAHLGLGERYPQIMADQRRIAQEHIAEIWAEQERKNAARVSSDTAPLVLTERYADGRPRRQPVSGR